MTNWRLIRAWVCFWIMQGIDAVSRLFPRSPTRARIVNALCRPFFGYGGYWALRSNPKEGWRIRELERHSTESHPHER